MTTPRLLFAAIPPAEVVAALVRALNQQDLLRRLDDALFSIGNWHQSLSLRFKDTTTNLRKLARAGDSVVAPQFLMTINKVVGGHPDGGVMHWSIQTRGKPKGLPVLLAKVTNSLQAEGFLESVRHSPHITISYNAPSRLRSTGVEPVSWAVSEFCLVRGCGEPYHYEILKRWPLLSPELQSGPQLSLL